MSRYVNEMLAGAPHTEGPLDPTNPPGKSLKAVSEYLHIDSSFGCFRICLLNLWTRELGYCGKA